MDLKDLNDLVKVVNDNKLDYLEVNGVKISKSNHQPLSAEPLPVKLTPEEKKAALKKEEDELLYFSSDV